MYQTSGYPIDIRLRAQRARERAEWRARKASAVRRRVRQLRAIRTA